MPLNRTNAVRLEQKLDERDKVMSHTVECVLSENAAERGGGGGGGALDIYILRLIM